MSRHRHVCHRRGQVERPVTDADATDAAAAASLAAREDGGWEVRNDASHPDLRP
jgi:hypothetical protein